MSLTRKLCKNWQTLEEISGPTSGIGVNGSEFQFYCTKLFTVKMGEMVKKVPLSIASFDCGLIFGLDTMKKFDLSIHFANDIQVFCGEHFLNTVYSGKEPKPLFAHGMNKVSINKYSTKLYTIYHPELINNQSYYVSSHADFPSLSIPCITMARDGSVTFPLNNTQKNKIHFKPAELGFNIEKISEQEVGYFNDQNVKDGLFRADKIPIPVYNRESKFNVGFYGTNLEKVVRLNFLNGVYSRNVKNDEINAPDKNSMAYLEQLEGFEIPDLHFPIRSTEQIVNEDISDITESQRLFLQKEFGKYDNLAARFSYDAGQLTDWEGKPIQMTIKLKGEIPKMTRAYKLNEPEMEQVNSILDYLIHFGLARESEIGKQYGTPVFIVPRPSSQRGGRLVFDCRKINEYIEDGISTHSDTCLTIPIYLVKKH